MLCYIIDTGQERNKKPVKEKYKMTKVNNYEIDNKIKLNQNKIAKIKLEISRLKRQINELKYDNKNLKAERKDMAKLEVVNATIRELQS